MTELPTISQYFINKKGGNPSGPGDLSGARSKVAHLISSLEISTVRNSLSTHEIIGEMVSKSRSLSKWHNRLDKTRKLNSLDMAWAIYVGELREVFSVVTNSLI